MAQAENPIRFEEEFIRRGTPYIIGTCKTDGNQVALGVGSLTLDQISQELEKRPAIFTSCRMWFRPHRGTLADQFEWRVPSSAGSPTTSSSS